MSADAPQVVLATGNPGKVREFRSLLGALPAAVVSLAEVGEVVFPEEGDDYRENAIAKARAVADQLGTLAIADDSGLEVEALGGAPGPRSARYGGPGLSDHDRLLRLLAEIGDREGRGARFVCHAALAIPGGRTETEVGICCGEITLEPSGGGGFGYDPIFRPEGYGVAMAEIPADEKDRISHRGRAFAALMPAIREALAEAAKRT